MTAKEDPVFRGRIRVFRAIDDYKSCQRYVQGHIDVLRIFGITEITSANEEWFYNPNAFVVVAEKEPDYEMVGGVRVHAYGGTQPLPIEDAVGEKDNYIYQLVKELDDQGKTGELCGLWNSRKVAGMGLSHVLLRTAIAVLDQLKFTTLVGICDINNLDRFFGRLGFEIERSVGNNGTFYYPKSDLIAVAVIIRNIYTLDSSEKESYDKIMELRSNHYLHAIEQGPKGNMEVNYNIELDKT